MWFSCKQKDFKVSDKAAAGDKKIDLKGTNLTILFFRHSG